MNRNDLPKLNFPPLEIPVELSDGERSPAGSCQAMSLLQRHDRIFDPLRKKWVALTPEEWVRQHFVRWMCLYLGYPPSMMANEYGLNLNGCRRRCDTVVFSRDLRPVVIVEYKAPHIDITQKVFDQIYRYNLVCGARCLIVSNGLSHYCCLIDYSPPKCTFLVEVPDYRSVCTGKPQS